MIHFYLKCTTTEIFSDVYFKDGRVKKFVQCTFIILMFYGLRASNSGPHILEHSVDKPNLKCYITPHTVPKLLL